jgi:hypothetical protein
MIIRSNVTEKKYQWIRVPRTATMAYSELFFSQAPTDIPNFHTHRKYNEFFTCGACINLEKMNLDAFTMVRNPVDRFVSSIYFIAARGQLYSSPDNIYKQVNKYCEICGNIETVTVDPLADNSPNNFFQFYKNEEIFYQFFYDSFDKNCKLKAGLDLYSVFDTSNISLIGSFLYTQVHWAYHPKVKIFKYEEIDKFNSWIEAALGYDTSRLTHINASRKKELSSIINIDFTTNEFKKLAKHLFYDDFRYFNYEFPI